MAYSMVRDALAHALTPVARYLTRQRARVLFYHRFGEGSRFMSAQVLETQLRYLKRHFNPISLGQFMEANVLGNPLPANAVVVTIDDGYADFLQIAYPLLQRYSIPATLYVVSQFAAGELWLWFDRIRYVCEHCELPEVAIDTAHEELRVMLASPTEREAAWDRLATYALALPVLVREQLIEQLSQVAQVAIPSRAPARFTALTFAQLRSLDPALIEIGAHTRTHATLSGCTGVELENEVAGCRNELEHALDRPVAHFCYPNGQAGDFGTAAIRCVQAARYRSACISFGGLTALDSHPLLLPRIPASADLREFRRNVDGVTDWNDRFKEQGTLLPAL